MTLATVALTRATLLLVDSFGELQKRIEAGESVWTEYSVAAVALAQIAPAIASGASGRLLTTAQLAESLNVSPKTVLRRRKKGLLQAEQLGQHGRGALRWPSQVAGQ